MIRRLLLRCWSAILGVALGGAADGAPRNVVFILIDDMRYDAMSCMSHPFVETPAIDRLAAAGVRFDRAFVTTSLCSPSRASYLTGTYAHRHGILDPGVDPTSVLSPGLHRWFVRRGPIRHRVDPGVDCKRAWHRGTP